MCVCVCVWREVAVCVAQALKSATIYDMHTHTHKPVHTHTHTSANSFSICSLWNLILFYLLKFYISIYPQFSHFCWWQCQPALPQLLPAHICHFSCLIRACGWQRQTQLLSLATLSNRFISLWRFRRRPLQLMATSLPRPRGSCPPLSLSLQSGIRVCWRWRWLCANDSNMVTIFMPLPCETAPPPRTPIAARVLISHHHHRTAANNLLLLAYSSSASSSLLGMLMYTRSWQFNSSEKYLLTLRFILECFQELVSTLSRVLACKFY